MYVTIQEVAALIDTVQTKTVDTPRAITCGYTCDFELGDGQGQGGHGLGHGAGAHERWLAVLADMSCVIAAEACKA